MIENLLPGPDILSLGSVSRHITFTAICGFSSENNSIDYYCPLFSDIAVSHIHVSVGYDEGVLKGHVYMTEPL